MRLFYAGQINLWNALRYWWYRIRREINDCKGNEDRWEMFSIIETNFETWGSEIERNRQEILNAFLIPEGKL